jgi:hypothetical protein
MVASVVENNAVRSLGYIIKVDARRVAPFLCLKMKLENATFPEFGKSFGKSFGRPVRV